ncbi:GNAT family N-acetyltransferase [Arthrobacter globiformis]|uniref:GNAT family N-acetyltransferase n=1 Tax=Arthrobacter globiformis TaxID=1665 RepID=UPI000B409B37|nr:GNAT family N-acetyltransferase [Arthrobacter globiformis]
MGPTCSVRQATAEDAEALARLHLECWRETYAHLLSPGFMAGQGVEGRLAMWRHLLAGPHAAGHFVAVDGGRLVGFAGSLPPEDGVREQTELWGIYLLASHQGRGLGQALLDATIGHEAAALWVAEENPRAQAFYQRNGFVFTGARDTIEDWEGLPELRMARPAP